MWLCCKIHWPHKILWKLSVRSHYRMFATEPAGVSSLTGSPDAVSNHSLMLTFPLVVSTTAGSVANKPGARSSLLVDWPNSIITGGRSDQIQSVQMATLRVRNHSSLRPLVFTLRPQLSRSRRNDE